VTARRTVPAFIGRSDLCARWGISRTTSYELQAKGYLPRPARLGGGVLRWPLAEIERIEASADADRGARRAS
jgi:predicted DNA-binding transcriptional regulator AlpA